MKKLILLFAIVVCLFGIGMLYSNDFVLADKDLELDYPTTPSDPTVTPETTKTTLPEYIKYLFNFLIGIGGILAFTMFLYGGVMWALSAGNPGIIGLAKKKMINGGMGLALLFCSYLIIYTINPDLTIMRLGLDWVSTTGPETTPLELDPKMYQEIPIGLLVENILAKNISCFDDDKNLINCRTEEFIAGPIDDIFDRDSHYSYCYKYDEQGNKKELMEYHDRMDCIKELTKAIEMKSAMLREASEEIKTIVNSECKCANCNGPGNCYCDGPDNCFCCGSPREEEPPSCSGNPPTPTLKNDPCTLAGRKKIDDAKNNIYQIINGTEQKIEGKDIVDNPDHDTKNLSLIEAKRRFEKLKQELNDDLDILFEAEELVKFPSYVKRLNLQQYLDKKIFENLKKQDFKNFSPPGYDSVARYCKIFNCSGDDEKDPVEKDPEIIIAPPAIMLTLDRSGTMAGMGLINSKKAANSFLDLIENDSYETEVGLVSFSGRIRLDCGLTTNIKQVRDALFQLIGGGGTNMGDALIMSMQELKGNAKNSANWTIIYFTDGKSNSGPSKEEIINVIVPEAKNADITIHTIGYGSGVKGDFLKEVAEATGGKYYPAATIDDLEDIYEKFYMEIITESPPTNGGQPEDPYIENGDICAGYGLNSEGILCNLFVLDGAPSTFYHNIKEYEKEN